MFDTVLSDLVNDRVQLEHELERVANLDVPVPEKVDKIKVALKNLAINDLMIGKWQRYMPLPDNEDSNTEENGETE